MAEELNSQDVYDDSDLAPLTGLFREMGGDRSAAAQFFGGFEDIIGNTANVLSFGTQNYRDSFNQAIDNDIKKYIRTWIYPSRLL